MEKNMSDEENSYIRYSSSEPESEPGSYNSMDSDNYAGYNIPVNYPPVEYDFSGHYVIEEGRNEGEGEGKGKDEDDDMLYQGWPRLFFLAIALLLKNFFYVLLACSRK